MRGGIGEGGEVLVIRRRVEERVGMSVKVFRMAEDGKGQGGRRDRMRLSSLGRE